MPGISIGGVPKWYSPGYRYGPNTRISRDPVEIEKMRKAVEEDMAKCLTCQEHGPRYMIRHYSGHVRDDEAYTYHCRSFSRWYNWQTGRMEGSAHCTCDGCF